MEMGGFRNHRKAYTNERMRAYDWCPDSNFFLLFPLSISASAPESLVVDLRCIKQEGHHIVM